MTTPLIELRHIGKDFAGIRALDDVSLTIAKGEIHCLAGENGSGKSTLIKTISGVYKPDRGEILMDGEPLGNITPALAIERGVQVIYQDFSLFGNLTVAENLALGTELRERRRLIRWGRVRRVAEEAVRRLGVHLDLDARVENLPTAGKQLVAIARALMADARLLIMDEPTTALTGREVETLFGIVRDIQSRGIAVLFVSHKMREMFDISERLTVIRNGRLVAEGAMRDFDEAAITHAMTGQVLTGEPFAWTPPAEPETPRLRIEGLSVPGELESLDLDIAPGEIVGISGLLGSGRTELALALFGMRPNYRGRIRIDGVETAISSVQTAIKAGIGYVPEDRLSEGLFLPQSIDRNILASSYDELAPHVVVQAARAQAAADGMIREMQVATPTGDRPVMQLSGGNQQRVVIGRWLMRNPRLLILNGPTVGVDVGSKAGIHRKIRELARSRGLSVLMISDDVPELVQNCNRIVLMHRGRFVETWNAAETSEDAIGERLKALA